MTNKPEPRIYASDEASALAKILAVVVEGLSAERKNAIATKVSEIATEDQGKLGSVIREIGEEILGQKIPYQKDES